MSVGSPLSGVTVVVTRARAQSQKLIDLLSERGASVVQLPVIRIDDPEDGGTSMREAAKRFIDGEYDWVVFTSTNAAERLVRFLDVDRPLGSTKIAVVGAATRAMLEARGLVVDLVPSTANAKGLAGDMPHSDRPPVRQGDTASARGKVLFPRAAGAGDTLQIGLRAKGWDVDDVVAYRTVAARPEEGATESAIEAASHADVVTFTSPSTVRFFLEILSGRRVPPVIACIGPVTAGAANDAGLTVDVVSEDQSAESLASTIAENWATLAGRYD